MTDPDLEVTRIRRFGTIVARNDPTGRLAHGLHAIRHPWMDAECNDHLKVCGMLSHGLPANMSWSKCTVVV